MVCVCAVVVIHEVFRMSLYLFMCGSFPFTDGFVHNTIEFGGNDGVATMATNNIMTSVLYNTRVPTPVLVVFVCNRSTTTAASQPTNQQTNNTTLRLLKYAAHAIDCMSCLKFEFNR